MPHSAEATGPTPFFLNVIFHGPFIFAMYSNRIEVLLPDIKEHIVGAGTFKSERPCLPDIYSLIGIKTDQSAMVNLDPKHFVLDANKTKFQIASESYYRFILQPLPYRIIPLGLLTLTSLLVLTGNDARSITNPPVFGSAHSFTYKIEVNKDEPQLENMQWTPVVRSGDNVNSINLHIFAESPYLLDLLHPNRDFTSLVAYLAGLSLDAQRPFPQVTSFVPNPDATQYGITKEEQGGLRFILDASPLVPPRICDAPSILVTNAT